MSDTEMGFRTAALGFRRDDVMAFIEKETARRTALENELTESEQARTRAERALQEADGASAALLADRDRLTEVLREREARLASLTAERDGARLETQDARTLLAQMQEQAAALQQTIEDMRAENAALAAKCAEYDEARRRLAEIELCAHARAEEIGAHAEEQARLLVHEAETLTTKTLAAVEQAKSEYRQALALVQRETDRVRTNAETALAGLDEAVEGLRARVTKTEEPKPEPAKPVSACPCTRENGKTLAEVLNGLRPTK